MFLMKPWTLLKQELCCGCYNRFAQLFSNLDSMKIVTDHAKEVIDRLTDDCEDFHSAISNIRNTLYQHALQLESGRVIKDKEFLDQKSLITVLDKQVIVRKVLITHQNALDKENLTFDKLVDNDSLSILGSSLNLNLITIIIREALCNKRIPKEKLKPDDQQATVTAACTELPDEKAHMQ